MMEICPAEWSEIQIHIFQSSFCGCCVSTGVTEMESERISSVTCLWLSRTLKKDVRRARSPKCVKDSLIDGSHIPSLSTLFMIKTSNNQCCDDQNKGYTRHCDKSLSIFGCVDLLPHYEWKPCLEDIRHFVHTAYDKRSLLVIFGANLVSPAVIGCQIRCFGQEHKKLPYAMHSPLRPNPAPEII
jgi:hypothetical protein